jgi:hypothetical protein
LCVAIKSRPPPWLAWIILDSPHVEMYHIISRIDCLPNTVQNPCIKGVFLHFTFHPVTPIVLVAIRIRIRIMSLIPLVLFINFYICGTNVLFINFYIYVIPISIYSSICVIMAICIRIMTLIPLVYICDISLQVAITSYDIPFCECFSLF